MSIAVQTGETQIFEAGYTPVLLRDDVIDFVRIQAVLLMNQQYSQRPCARSITCWRSASGM